MCCECWIALCPLLLLLRGPPCVTLALLQCGGKYEAALLVLLLLSLHFAKLEHTSAVLSCSLSQVQSGLECGLGADDFLQWQEGDVVNAFIIVTKSQRLEEARAATAVDLSTLGV